jgi:crotonobetainyl-CoA:carnitine CoA-transferase CaiB-like acyl-CoA transferase
MARTGALAPYRILDLTDERGWLAGKTLADLGAQVTKIEPPGGDPGRRPPQIAAEDGDADGFAWRAFNRGKRSATLDLTLPAGRDLFRKLLAHADAVIESFAPGQMEDWDLGLDVLHAVNPRLVLTRITAFGQTGPYAHYASSDLILSALSGAAWLAGDEDRAPVRVTAPQYFQHASAEAALHTAAALSYAAVSGRGQQLDVSAQAAGVRTLMNGLGHAYTDGRLLRREGFGRPQELLPVRSVFPCADGYVVAFFNFGGGLGAYRAWAQDEGERLPEALAALTDEELGQGQALFAARPQTWAAELSAFFEAFLAKRTGRQLLEGSIRRHVLISVINTLSDVVVDDQLAARGYFQPVQERSGQSANYPTLWAHLTATPLVSTPTAPLAGEHNETVWRAEVGLDEAEWKAAQAEGVL